jgi:hypothetical protein
MGLPKHICDPKRRHHGEHNIPVKAIVITKWTSYKSFPLAPEWAGAD